MKPSRLPLVILIFLGLLTIPFSLIPSQIMNYLTGLLQTGSSVSFSSIWPGMLLFFLATVGVAVLNIAKTYLSGVVLEQKVQNRIMQLFGRLLRTNPDFFQHNEPAKVSKRVIHETRQVESFWFGLQVETPLTLIGLFGFGYVLFCGLDPQTPLIGSFLPEGYAQTGNWLLATLIILLAPLQSTLLLFDKKIQNVNRRAMIVDDDVANISLETFQSVPEIRNHFAFSYALERVRAQLDRLRQLEIDITKLRSLFSGIGPILDGLSKVLLLALGAWLCLHDINIPLVGISVGKIAWSDYLGFSGMALVVNGYMKSLGDALFQWRMTREAIRRVDEYDTLPQAFEHDPVAPVIEGHSDPINFAAVTFQSGDGTRILNDLNFTIRPGEHVAFVGPSGCGKSTTMNLLIRELRHSDGNLSFSDKAIGDCDFLSLSQEVGQVRQRPILMDESLRDNILLGLQQRLPDEEKELNARLQTVITKVGLKQDILKKALDRPLPKKYLTSKLAEQLAELKKQLATKLPDHSDLLEPFAPQQFLRNATLLDNILFGMEENPDQSLPGDGSFTPAVRWVLKCLEKSALADKLLALGSQLFRYDQNVAMQLHYQAPKLLELLSSLQQSGEEADHLGAELASAATTTGPTLPQLKKRQQQLLISLALTSEVRMAERIGLDQQLEGEIIALRQQLLQEQGQQNLAVARFDQETNAALTLRENLLGGRVRGDVRGAQGQLDELILTTAAAMDCEQTLLLCGLESPAGLGGQHLSGGQAMKVAIARILLKEPNILLLDEATAALDEKSQAQIVELIRNDFKDKTVISISHRLSTIRDYDRILVFDRGQLVDEGRYDELVTREGLFRELVSQEQGALPPLEGGQELQAPAPRETQESVDASEIQRAIALSPAFAGMPTDQVLLLERMAQIQRCPAGTVLFQRGDDGDELFIIMAGEVEFFVTAPDGSEEVIDCFATGKTFGELAVFGNVPRTLSARTKSAALFCTLSRDNILKLIDIYPALAVSLLATVAKQISTMRDAIYQQP